MKIIRVADYETLSSKTADLIAAQVLVKPNCILGLATGSTPIGTYEKLIEWHEKKGLDFSEVTSINLDEYVGLDSNDKNSYRFFMNYHLFEHINIVRSNTYVPNGMTKDWEKECEMYDHRILQLGGIDLQLLGIGNNGHIGFNEWNLQFKQIHVSLKRSKKFQNRRLQWESEQLCRQKRYF